jgi:type VI secretion system protein ImpK
MKEESNNKTDLTTLSSECITLILQLRAARSVDDPSRLRSKVKEVLDRLERRAKDAGVESEDVQNTKFALVSFIDEAITTSSFSGKEDWLANPLQLELFGRNDAGEEFFRRLSQLRQRPQAYTQTLEVYYLCLVLGYKGKFFYQDTESLRGLVDDTKADLFRVKDRSASQKISPHGMPQDNIAKTVYKEVPLWIIASAAAVIGFVFFLVMTFMLNSAASSATGMIR